MIRQLLQEERHAEINSYFFKLQINTLKAMDALCNIGQTDRSVLNCGMIFCKAFQHHIK